MPEGSVTEREAEFKRCSCCRHAWRSRAELLADPAVELAGYQVDFGDLELGFLLFNHSCRSTFAVPVEAFADLHDGPIYRERETGSEACLGLCLRRDELGPCPARCECAWVRDVLQVVRGWPKRGA